MQPTDGTEGTRPPQTQTEIVPGGTPDLRATLPDSEAARSNETREARNKRVVEEIIEEDIQRGSYSEAVAKRAREIQINPVYISPGLETFLATLDSSDPENKLLSSQLPVETAIMIMDSSSALKHVEIDSRGGGSELDSLPAEERVQLTDEIQQLWKDGNLEAIAKGLMARASNVREKLRYYEYNEMRLLVRPELRSGLAEPINPIAGAGPELTRIERDRVERQAMKALHQEEMVYSLAEKGLIPSEPSDRPFKLGIAAPNLEFGTTTVRTIKEYQRAPIERSWQAIIADSRNNTPAPAAAA